MADDRRPARGGATPHGPPPTLRDHRRGRGIGGWLHGPEHHADAPRHRGEEGEGPRSDRLPRHQLAGRLPAVFLPEALLGGKPMMGLETNIYPITNLGEF